MHEKDFSNMIEWYNNNAEEYSKKLTTATSAEAVAEFITAVQTVGSEILESHGNLIVLRNGLKRMRKNMLVCLKSQC